MPPHPCDTHSSSKPALHAKHERSETLFSKSSVCVLPVFVIHQFAPSADVLQYTTQRSIREICSKARLRKNAKIDPSPVFRVPAVHRSARRFACCIVVHIMHMCLNTCVVASISMVSESLSVPCVCMHAHHAHLLTDANCLLQGRARAQNCKEFRNTRTKLSQPSLHD
jgi:hypothetical protein